MAWDTSDLDWDGFWNPLLTLLYVDFIGTMGFLYAAADLSGLIDPAHPETFPGCYAAFMADAVSGEPHKRDGGGSTRDGAGFGP